MMMVMMTMATTTTQYRVFANYIEILNSYHVHTKTNTHHQPPTQKSTSIQKTLMKTHFNKNRKIQQTQPWDDNIFNLFFTSIMGDTTLICFYFSFSIELDIFFIDLDIVFSNSVERNWYCLVLEIVNENTTLLFLFKLVFYQSLVCPDLP